MNLYEIKADYRPNNPNKPKYYVHANTIKEAKKRFNDLISWLVIYNVTQVCEEESNIICSKPDEYIII